MPEPGRSQGCGLFAPYALDTEILDLLLEQPVEIQLGVEMQEDAAEADRGAIHEDEFARHRHRPAGPAIDAGFGILQVWMLAVLRSHVSQLRRLVV